MKLDTALPGPGPGSTPRGNDLPPPPASTKPAPAKKRPDGENASPDRQPRPAHPAHPRSPPGAPLRHSPARALSPDPAGTRSRAFSPPPPARSPPPVRLAPPRTDASSSPPRPQSSDAAAPSTSQDAPAPASSAPQPAGDRPRVTVYIHPDDARDKVLAAIIKVIMRTGNTPATPRELSGMILKGNVALLGGNTPHATVSSRISQHFKRCSEHNPPRKPILGKWANEGERKLRYYVDQDDPPIPVAEVPEARLALRIPHTGVDERLLPDLDDTIVILRPRREGEPPGSPIPDHPRPKPRIPRPSRPSRGEPTSRHKTRSSGPLSDEDPEYDPVVPPSAGAGKRKRGRPSKASLYAEGLLPGPGVASSDAVGSGGSEEDEDGNYGSPVRKKRRSQGGRRKKGRRARSVSDSEDEFDDVMEDEVLQRVQPVAAPAVLPAAEDAQMAGLVRTDLDAAADLAAHAAEAEAIDGLGEEELLQLLIDFGAPSPGYPMLVDGSPMPSTKPDPDKVAALWLVEMGTPQRTPGGTGAAVKREAEGGKVSEHPPLGGEPSDATFVASSKRASFGSPAATPPSRLLYTSAAVTPIGAAANIVVGKDTDRVLRYMQDPHAAFLETVRREPRGRGVGKESPTGRLSSARSGSSSGGSAGRIDEIRKAPHDFFERDGEEDERGARERTPAPTPRPRKAKGIAMGKELPAPLAQIAAAYGDSDSDSDAGDTASPRPSPATPTPPRRPAYEDHAHYGKGFDLQVRRAEVDAATWERWGRVAAMGIVEAFERYYRPDLGKGLEGRQCGTGGAGSPKGRRGPASPPPRTSGGPTSPRASGRGAGKGKAGAAGDDGDDDDEGRPRALPTPEPTPGRRARKAEYVSSVIRLRHVGAMPENRLQVMSLYEMDADGALFAKVKSGMLAGIVHCRGAGGAEGVEVNVDLANYINAEPFFRLLPGAASGDPDVDAVLARCRAARERKSWAEGGKTRGKGGKGQDALRAIEVVLLGGVDAADADEENAVVVVTADAAGLEAGESVDKELDGIWVPLRCATALAESLPQPLPEQLADLLSVDDEELGTTTEEEDDKDSDGDIELPQANADLLTAMAAESAAEGPAFDGMLPPASANVLRDIIGGLPSGAVPRSTRQGRARPGSRGASATTTPKRPTGIRTDVSSPQNFPAAFSPVLRELFAEDDASLFSGDDSQSYFNLSSDGEDAAMASGEQSGDHAPLIPGDESDGPGRETRASSGDPIAGEEDERTSKLAEAGLPSIIISALELHHATIPLPPPSAPVWKTSVDGVDVYLTVLPRPRVGSQPSTPSRGEAPFALLGSQIPIVRRVDDGSVNATTLLLAGGLVSDRERSTVLSLEVHKIKIRKKPGLLGTWIPLKRARELSRTYLLESKLAFFLSDGLPRVFAGVDGPVQKSDKGSGSRRSKSRKAVDVPIKPTSQAASEKLIKKLQKLVAAGGPGSDQMVDDTTPTAALLEQAAAASLDAEDVQHITAPGRRESAGLQVLNATLTSISTGAQAKDDLFLISPSLRPAEAARSIPPLLRANTGSKDHPPTSLLNERDPLGIPDAAVMADALHVLAQGWESSDDDGDEARERRREIIRKRHAAASAAEAAARARAQETDSEGEEESSPSWFGSDDDDEEEERPPEKRGSSDEETGYERDVEDDATDSEGDASPTATPSGVFPTTAAVPTAAAAREGSATTDDEGDVAVERTVIVTTSITIKPGALKARQDITMEDASPGRSTRAAARTRGTPVGRSSPAPRRPATPKAVSPELPPMGSFGGPAIGSFGPPTPSPRLTPGAARPASPAPKIKIINSRGSGSVAAAAAAFPRILHSPPNVSKRPSDSESPDAKRQRSLAGGKGKGKKKLGVPDGDETEEDEDMDEITGF